MKIVILYLDNTIKRLIQIATEYDRHSFIATNNPDEALRAMEQTSGPCLLLADNFLVTPAAVDALRRLASTPELRRRVRVIGLSARSGSAVDTGVVEAVLPLPFTYQSLVDAITAQVRIATSE